MNAINNRCQPKATTYRARSYFPLTGKVTWYLTHDYHHARWCWTKDADRQASFRDDGELFKAIAEAGSRNEKIGVRNVIVETITHEEQELSHFDHPREHAE
ncbi:MULTISPECIES: hypothetical protein [unclassified Ensifer]|uniref:hypothetical protein n=1 Tax=unclassified Ensifer TaxID=2633371 RepID=UPI000812C609|nr:MULTISPECIES: hypothetical protein [unclassified Ensifer]OCP16678.1 hypothetical protein BC361_32765 [Ensifer sp. LC54]OCP17898.1 hypothetical protein BC363_32950 [Ensifer sp. LC384]